VSETESSGLVASSKTVKTVNWYDMTLMDEENWLPDQSAAEGSRRVFQFRGSNYSSNRFDGVRD
jgi:hypothetical protein